jgi:uncharacterized protein involved in high-affinity Fe2+ transport
MMPRTAHPRRRAVVAALAPLAAVLVVVGGAAPRHTVAVPAANATTVPGPPAGWTTVFSDNFSGAAGTGVNTANWLYDTGTGYPGGAANWGTGEVETMTNSTANVYQDGNGHLVIKPVETNGTWTSGRIETQNSSFEAPPGGEMEMTASIEQPNPANGLGYWPAFWAMGSAARGVGATNWPSIGEFDIMEDVNALSEVSHTFHCGVDPGGPCNETNGISSNLLACSGCQTGYHTYSIIVDRTNTSAEQLRWYVDGNLEFTVNEDQVPVATWQAAVDHGFFMILNVAMGGVYPNRICGCTTPTTATSSGAGMSVAYVAVYETTGGGGTTTEAPYGGTAAAVPGTVQAENYDTGGQGVAYNVTSVNGTANAYRSDGVDLEATTDTGGGYDLGWTAATQWFKYTVNVATAGTYTVGLRLASPNAVADGLHIDNSAGTNLSGNVNVPATGGYQDWTTVTATVTLPAGTQTLTVDQDNAGWNINYLTFSSTGGGGGEAPYGGTAAAVPGAVYAENYDTGGQGVAYNVTSVNGTDNAYRSDGVDLELTTDTGGPANDLGWTAAGQWFKYTVNVATAGTYTVGLRLASPTAVTDGLHIDNSAGTNLSGNVNVPATGGYQDWTTVTATVTLPAGVQTLTVDQDNGGWNINFLAFGAG